ncbi:MAG: ROK family protein [Candidatus Dormibacteria bacterium]|jgi:glucokinase
MTMDSHTRVIGIDAGGTFGSGMRGALVDGTASLIARKEAITPRTSQEELIETLVTMGGRLAELARRDGVEASAVGVAVPGLIDETTGVVHRSPNLTLSEVGLGQILQERLHLPAFLVHDATAGAIGEYAVGVGRGVSDMLLVVMGTGVGSAVISGGHIVRGAHGTAGEIGHIVIDPAGMLCGCGGHGCVETFASETSIARRYTMAAKEALLAGEVITKAAAGDAAAARVWNDALGALATVIATAVALIDCQLVVLTGTMKITSEALAPLGRLLANRINLIQQPRVAVGALGDAAGVLGAAAVAFERAGLGDATHTWRQSSRLAAAVA